MGLQDATEVALITTEVKYIALITALRECIPLMELVQDMLLEGFKMEATKPKFYSKVFEDNSGANELAIIQKT